MTFLRLILDNIWRNPLRTLLTSLGTMVMVLVVITVFSVLSFLAKQMSDKNQNLKAIVTERWQAPSMMPASYADSLERGGGHRPGDVEVESKNAMSWGFYVGATDPDPRNRTIQTMMFAFCQQPHTLLDMMEELDELKGEERAAFAEVVKKLENNKQGLIVGRERLKALNKRVGDTVRVYGLNYKGIDLDFEIVGEFPIPRYDMNASMRSDYLQDALDQWSRENKGQKHAMVEKSLALVWLRLSDKPTFEKVSDQVVTNPSYSAPSVKLETLSSAIGNFLEAWRDIIWGMRFLLAPAILFTLSLVIANSISISVRERRMEFAVLKVLGFRPWQILLLVLGEALLVGTLSGLVSAGGAQLAINEGLHGLRFPIAFFGVFFIDDNAWWWGVAIGAGTAFAGSVWPAWSARTVRVAEVFAKIA
jgi:putative ABC transport system permease protein